MILKILISVFFLTYSLSTFSQPVFKLRKRDRHRDVQLITDKGSIIIRLSDSTPKHRDNFLKLVKLHFYDSLPFHRVINHFMIQAGDNNLKRIKDSSYDYTIPSEINLSLFHRRGVIAAARMSDSLNPMRASSGTQFYIVQGKQFKDSIINTMPVHIINRSFSPKQRAAYTTVGGAPWLDGEYTVFGEVIKGMGIIDMIASVPVKEDRPVSDIYILKTKLIRRKAIHN